MNRNVISYNTPTEWLKNNRKKLSNYAGEWIAFSNSGIIAHDKNGRLTAQQARASQQKYVLKYVHPLEIPRVIRLLPVRVQTN